MAHTLRARSGHALHDLCGATTLGALASLLQRGKLLICNDTGVSHLAASVRLPSVVIASGSDVARWRRWMPLVILYCISPWLAGPAHTMHVLSGTPVPWVLALSGC